MDLCRPRAQRGDSGYKTPPDVSNACIEIETGHRHQSQWSSALADQLPGQPSPRQIVGLNRHLSPPQQHRLLFPKRTAKISELVPVICAREMWEGSYDELGCKR